MAYDDSQLDETYYQQPPPNFWNQQGPGPGSITPVTTPTIDFQGQTQYATPQPGVYSPQQTAAAGANPFFPNGQFNGDYQGYFNTLFPGGTLTGADLKAKEAELAKAGLKLKTSASGNTAWVVLPDGREVDVIGDYGGANTKQWLIGGGGDAGPRPQVDTSGLLNGSVLAPFTERGPNITPPGPFNFTGGMPAPFSFDQYKPTTAADIFGDPSYEFRFGEGNRSVMAQRVARGMAKTGGTLKALDRYGQNFGSQEFSNVDTRRFRDYNTNYLQARDAYNTNVVDPNNMAYSRARDAYDLNVVNPNQTEYSRGLTDYLNRERIYRANQNGPFDKSLAVARLGYDSTA